MTSIFIYTSVTDDDDGRADSPSPPDCRHQRHKITKHCFVCFVRARGRACKREDPCKIHRDADSKFWTDVEAHDKSLERRRERKGATTTSSRKSGRISSQPHRYAPLDFVATGQVSPHGSEKKGERKQKTPRKQSTSSGSEGECVLCLCCTGGRFPTSAVNMSSSLFFLLEKGGEGDCSRHLVMCRRLFVCQGTPLLDQIRINNIYFCR